MSAASGLSGRADDQLHVKIACSLAARGGTPARNAFAFEPEDGPAVGVGRHRQRHLAVERRHRDLAAQDRLFQRDGQIETQVVAVPDEIGMGGH